MTAAPPNSTLQRHPAAAPSKTQTCNSSYTWSTSLPGEQWKAIYNIQSLNSSTIWGWFPQSKSHHASDDAMCVMKFIQTYPHCIPWYPHCTFSCWWNSPFIRHGISHEIPWKMSTCKKSVNHWGTLWLSFPKYHESWQPSNMIKHFKPSISVSLTFMNCYQLSPSTIN